MEPVQGEHSLCRLLDNPESYITRCVSCAFLLPFLPAWIDHQDVPHPNNPTSYPRQQSIRGLRTKTTATLKCFVR
ncbi:hypothetical protein T01_10539 [Trichinella spiralis]|uniref:Uncharacterized protein n=1 Tax=Trichinella spiralis TaxID=6334 RepID=A0A0V1B3J1_TRISP|nr:hypothetical protein T01_10539 [Trichinella spiralis]